MDVLITGGSGFVGGWLHQHLIASGDSVTVTPDGLDITDRAALAEFVAAQSIDVTFHLAALTHVGRSWSDPIDFYQVNVIGTQNLVEALAAHHGGSRLILISSSEVYGRGPEASNHDSLVSISESEPLRPVNPYAASKAASEMVALQGQYGRDLQVVVARPFNHVGPGQGDQFVVAGLARRIVEAELSNKSWIPVGSLEARRDFTDVRDVVRAYRLLALHGVPGEAYNVSSGRALSIQSVADALIACAGSDIELRTDPSLLRAVDISITVGDHSKLTAATGWGQMITFEATLVDTLSYWRSRLV